MNRRSQNTQADRHLHMPPQIKQTRNKWSTQFIITLQIQKSPHWPANV